MFVVTDVAVFCAAKKCRQAASKAIKQMLDKKYGPQWNAVVGEAYGVHMTHQASTLMYMFFGGNLGICAWKI